MARLILAHGDQTSALVRQNQADHQGQLYFQEISWIKIKLTLMVRFVLAHGNKAEALFSWAGHQGQLYFHP